MKVKSAVLVAVMLFGIALVGCNKEAEPTPAADAGGDPAVPFEGATGELTGTNRLVLGTLMFEGTADAVTPTQASELLPLWQMMAGESLQGDAETQAVLKQIEGKMTAAQMAAIDAMALTGASWQNWMQKQGIQMPARPEGQRGGGGGFGELSEEERTQMREEFQNMSADERATRMAEMGVQRPEGGGQGFDPNNRPGGTAGGAGRLSFMFQPLIDLLTERAAE